MQSHPDPREWHDEWRAEREKLAAALAAASDKCESVARIRAESAGIDADAYIDALRAMFDVDIDALADALAERGIDIDALRAALPLVDLPAAYEYRDADAALYSVPDAPADHAINRKRADGTVRGIRRGYIVSSHARTMQQTFSRLAYSDALHAANALLADDPALRLIGTDEWAWSQIVHYRPPTIVVDGKVYGMRPESDGVPIVNDAFRATGKRKPAARRQSRPRYYVRPDVVIELGAWPMLPYRIVKRYRMTHEGRTMVGFHRVDTVRVARKKARKPQGPRVDVATLADAMTHAEPMLRAAFDDKRTQRIRYRAADGATATIGTDAERNRYRLRIRRADGSSMTSTFRSIDALRAAVTKGA